MCSLLIPDMVPPSWRLLILLFLLLLPLHYLYLSSESGRMVKTFFIITHPDHIILTVLPSLTASGGRGGSRSLLMEQWIPNILPRLKLFKRGAGGREGVGGRMRLVCPVG